MENNLAPIKTGWWASQSVLKKGLIIGIPVILLGVGIWYFGFRKKDESKTEDGSDKKTTPENSGGDVITEQKSETTKTSSETTHAPQAKPAVTHAPSPKIDLTKLPNGGKGCGDVKTTYDGNYDYVRCNGIWYTQSKPNPKIESKKIATWISLGSNKIAMSKLNSRYPNG